MRNLIAACRAVCIITTYSAFALLGVFIHLCFFRSRLKRNYWLSLAAHYMASCSCFLFNIHVKIVGKWNPAPRALIVANHVGAPDIFVLGSCFRTFFVSKLELRGWPLIGYLSRLGATIFVDRSQRHQVKTTIKAICDRLEAGLSVVLFPEGGVSDGTRILPFRTSHLEAAIRARSPVLPVLIKYHDEHAPGIACWFKISFFKHILGLLKNPRLDVTVTIFPPITGQNRHELANTSYRLLHEEQRMNNLSA